MKTRNIAPLLEARVPGGAQPAEFRDLFPAQAGVRQRQV
jgi:hypothetical protein